MSEHNTGISWTHRPGTRGRTWNPTRGCSRVSEGCRHCYAETMAARIVRMGKGKPTAYDGLVKIAQIPRSSDPATHESTEEPEWIPRPGGGAFAFGVEARWTGKVVLDAAKLAEPLRWREPSTVFVNSMSDLFHESLTNEQIAAAFGVMAACQQHTFIVLTKRARRMMEWTTGHGVSVIMREATELLFGNDYDRERLYAWWRDSNHRIGWPLPNVWLGVSVENQDAADKRIHDLRATPAAVRLLSCEPLLGHVDLDEAWGGWHARTEEGSKDRGVDWILAGCESGPGARPCDVAWLRSLRDQCSAAGVPFFLKQSRATYLTQEEFDADYRDTGDGCAGATRPIPVHIGEGSKRKPGGVIELPYLDGVQHSAFPEVRP